MSYHTYERRKLEIFLACLTSGFGFWLLLPASSMTAAAHEHLIAMAPESAWGGMFLTNGLSHCAWLAVNGARWWSPIVRLFAAFGSASLYLIWAAAIAQYDGASTAVYTYTGLSMSAAACCVFAWRDAITAIRIRHAELAHA